MLNPVLGSSEKLLFGRLYLLTEGGEKMDLKIGQRVKHKLTGQDMMVLEIGPRSKDVIVPGLGKVLEQYLAKEVLRVRLPDMKVIDVYEYEIDGYEFEADVETKIYLTEKNSGYGYGQPREGADAGRSDSKYSP